MLFRVTKRLEGDPELAGEIMWKTWTVTSWNSTSKIADSCRGSECLEMPIQAASPTISKRQAVKGKYTELI